MAEIVIIDKHPASRMYKKVLKSAGHNVHYLDHDDLNNLAAVISVGYFHADAIVLIVGKDQSIFDLVSKIREEPSFSKTPLIITGQYVEASLLRNNVFNFPQVNGSLFISILNRLVLQEESGKGSSKNSQVEKIIRSIEFPPEYHRSGVTILSYFADVLRHRNLSEDVKVSIEQNGLNVSLVIESPTGQRELIEQTLEAYGMVVTRRQPPEFLTTNPYELAELKSQLRYAEVQIETQRELLSAKNADVDSLRAEVVDTRALVRQVQEQASEDRARFMALMEGLVSHNTALATGLKELAQQAAQAQNVALAGALENLYKMIERGVREDDREEVMQNLTTIQREDPGVFQRVYDTLLMGAISEGAGNYLYSWLLYFVNTLPK